MKIENFRPSRFALILAPACMLISSCASNEALQSRLDRRTDGYSNLQERRDMRADSRDARYNAWYDRAMD